MVFILRELEQPRAQSLFLFSIVFGINLINFFDGKNNRATLESRKKFRLRLRLRLIYLGKIAEKVKYITYLGCAPARREGGAGLITGKTMKNKRDRKRWKEK